MSVVARNCSKLSMLLETGRKCKEKSFVVHGFFLCLLEDLIVGRKHERFYNCVHGTREYENL